MVPFSGQWRHLPAAAFRYECRCKVLPCAGRSYRVVAKTSYVDEALFGSSRPGSAAQEAQASFCFCNKVLARASKSVQCHACCLYQLGCNTTPPHIAIYMQKQAEKQEASSTHRNASGGGAGALGCPGKLAEPIVALTPSDLARMRQGPAVMSAEHAAALRREAEAAREGERAAARARKERMRALEQEARAAVSARRPGPETGPCWGARAFGRSLLLGSHGKLMPALRGLSWQKWNQKRVGVRRPHPQGLGRGT
jgi:hypothetical protein